MNFNPMFDKNASSANYITVIISTKSVTFTATLQQVLTVDGRGLFNVTLLFFKSYCNAPLNSIKLRMCNLIYIILIPLIAGFTRFTLKSLNRFSFKSIQQNLMVFAESIKLLTFSEIFDSIDTNHKIWFDIIQETCRKHHKHANNNLYATHNRLEHRRNSRRSFKNRNYRQQVQSLTLVEFRSHVTWGVTWPGSCIFTVQS